jgi:hypothetical protein
MKGKHWVLIREKSRPSRHLRPREPLALVEHLAASLLVVIQGLMALHCALAH